MSHQEVEILSAGSVRLLDREETVVTFVPDAEQVLEDWPDLADLSNEINPAESNHSVSATPPPREIAFDGSLRINGYVAGIINSCDGTLIVAPGGEVDADIWVRHAVIDGCVRGDIHASEKVELGGSARVIGDIETANLSIAPGAVFEGRCIFFHAPEPFDLSEPASNPEHARAAGTS